MSNDSAPEAYLLVVDDEDIVVSLIRDAFEDDNYVVKTASNGKDAVSLIEQHKFDLIITDVRMPNMSGIEMVEQARQIQPDVGVIFMTGYANLNSAKDAIKQGAFDYILKPFELNEIRQAVRNGLKVRSEVAEKSSSRQLERVSDLSEKLLKVGDRLSLISVSLEFALMHCQGNYCAFVSWDIENNIVSLITVTDNESHERQFSSDLAGHCIAQIEQVNLTEPVLSDEYNTCPLVGDECKLNSCPIKELDWFRKASSKLVIPVQRGKESYGHIVIGFNGRARDFSAADLKLLDITASQLAVSLENMTLLEETQSAYARLKELQDETIQLEKLATRGELSAEIGHELNNFIGVVAGNLSLLELHVQKGDYTKVSKYTGAMTANIEKIKQFTSDLMDFSSIASSKKETIYFDNLIREVIDYLKPQKRFADVSIRLEPFQDVIPFHADTTHIQQVLYNLFNNAADAMTGRPNKVIDVKVATDYQQQTFSVTIADSGSGIEPENLNRLFNEKFTTKEFGHGFGLVVCKRIIDAHGGRLDIQSTVDVGTTLTIHFPLASVEATETVAPA